MCIKADWGLACLEVPYCPPIDFELPDYKQVGKTWWQLAHSYHYDDAPPPVIDDIDPASLNFGAAEIGNSLPAPSIGGSSSS